MCAEKSFPSCSVACVTTKAAAFCHCPLACVRGKGMINYVCRGNRRHRRRHDMRIFTQLTGGRADDANWNGSCRPARPQCVVVGGWW